MTKKIFAQPNISVVRLHNNDIVTISKHESYNSTYETLAGDRMGREDWDAGY